MEGSLSDSQMWLPSQFRARMRDGRRKGSRRSGVVSVVDFEMGRVEGVGLTFEAALEGVEVEFSCFACAETLVEECCH